MKDFLLIISIFSFLGLGVYSLGYLRYREYWQCSSNQRGMTRNGGIVSVCDGKHWIPIRIAVPGSQEDIK